MSKLFEAIDNLDAFTLNEKTSGTLRYLQIDKDESEIRDLYEALEEYKITDYEAYEDEFVVLLFYRSNKELPIGSTFEEDDELMMYLKELYGEDSEDPKVSSGLSKLYNKNGDINEDIVMGCIKHAYHISYFDFDDYLNDDYDDDDDEDYSAYGW